MSYNPLSEFTDDEIRAETLRRGIDLIDSRVPQGRCDSIKSGQHAMSDAQVCVACGEPYDLE